jgi:hypothetical protein
MSVFERERERQTERERKKKKNPPPFSIFFHANRYHFLQYTRLTSGLFLSSPVSDQINHVIFEYEKIRELKKSLFFPLFLGGESMLVEKQKNTVITVRKPM